MSAQAQALPRYLPGPPLGRWRRLRSKLGWNAAIVIEVVVLLVVWEVAISGFELFNPQFVPPPTEIGDALARITAQGQLLRHLSYSGGNFIVGYLLAASLGVALGFALGSSARLRTALNPFVWLAYATPRVAIQPILVLWMGFGVEPKILIIFLMAFFPIVITVMEGVRNTDPTLLRAARVFGVRGAHVYSKIVFPASLPYVLTGLRIGIARALTGIVVGEFIGGTAGLGFAIRLAGQEFRVDTALAVTLVLIVLANVSMVTLQVVKRRLAPWDEEVMTRLR